jgi:hypothetical protein
MSDGDPQFRFDDRGGQPRTPSRPLHDVWRASASFGWLVGAALLLLCGIAIVVLLVRVPAASGAQRVAWIAIAAALTVLVVGIAVLLRALPSMRYRFSGDALVVEWLGKQRVVPLADIQEIVFEPNTPLRLPRWEPFWPGYYVATVRTPAGVWHSWATQRPQRRVRLVTSHGIIAISPERPVRFIADLERRLVALQSGEPASESMPAAVPSDEGLPRVSEQHPTSVEPPDTPPATRVERRPRRAAASSPLISWLLAARDRFRDRLLADQVASALVAAGVVLPVLMIAYLYSQYEGLPEQIPIRWDATGDVIGQTAPSGLWRFPRIAVVVLIVNTALATLLIDVDRYLARLLVSGIPLVQLILFIALVRAVN